MMDQSLVQPPDRQGLAQRLQRELLVQPVADRPADHPPSKQIQDHGQIQRTRPVTTLLWGEREWRTF